LQCHGTPLRFDAVVALGAYRDDLRQAVLRMKQPEGDPLSGAVARLLWLRRGEELTRFAADLIVPIPMHWARRLRRGTNSPERMAAVLGRHLKRPVTSGLLRWRRKTKLQSELPPKERFRNVRDAFRIARGRGVEGARILLIDDVLTTGATCSEAARTLKRAGASMVGAAVVARAEKDP
jgi:ComF family protein